MSAAISLDPAHGGPSRGLVDAVDQGRVSPAGRPPLSFSRLQVNAGKWGKGHPRGAGIGFQAQLRPPGRSREQGAGTPLCGGPSSRRKANVQTVPLGRPNMSSPPRWREIPQLTRRGGGHPASSVPPRRRRPPGRNFRLPQAEYFLTGCGGKMNALWSQRERVRVPTAPFRVETLTEPRFSEIRSSCHPEKGWFQVLGRRWRF